MKEEYYYYILFLQLLITPTLIKSVPGTISVEFQVAGDQQYILVPVSVGTPEQKINLIADINFDRTFIDNDVYEYQKSETFKSNGTTRQRSKEEYAFQGTLTTDLISIGLDKVQDFNFMFVSEVMGYSEITSVMALGRRFDSEEFCIINRLRSSSIIFDNIFSFKFFSFWLFSKYNFRNETSEKCRNLKIRIKNDKRKTW